MEKEKNFTLTYYFVLIAIGYLFPLFYVQLAEGRGEIGIFLSKYLGRKGLFTGREHIWRNFYEQMSKNGINYLIGIGSHTNIMPYGGTNNIHNTFLVVLMNFGLIGTFLYFLFFVLQINKIYSDRNITEYQIDLLYGGFSLFVLNIFETVGLWMPFILFVSFLWGMAKSFNGRSS